MMKRIVLTLLLAAIPLQATALENDDLLALVAMPLAVAAVSEITEVPMGELMDVVTLLNDAQVPPVQFVEIVRYAPVALVVEEDQPNFVDFVRVRYDDGMRGVALVNEIETRYETYGLNDVELNEPRVMTVNDTFFPAVVQTRLAEVKAHPHGGPPGQLKKAAGVQTGAEIVHGTTKAARKVRTAPEDDDVRRVAKREAKQNRGANREPKVVKQRVTRPDDHPGQGHGKVKDHGGRGKSGGGGKGNGKGKG